MRNMMKDRVDIYKLRIEEGETSYGVPSQPKFYYKEEPDEKDVKCSFQRSNKPSIDRKDGPFDVVSELYNLYLPTSVEIEENDMVVITKMNGKKVSRELKLFSSIPFTYRTHIEVELRRNDKWLETKSM